MATNGDLLTALVGLQVANRHLRPRDLTGPRYADARAAILSALLGVKVPKSKAGVNRLAEELESAVGAHGTCLADLSDNFAVMARTILDNPGLLEERRNDA